MTAKKTITINSIVNYELKKLKEWLLTVQVSLNESNFFIRLFKRPFSKHFIYYHQVTSI